MYFSLDEAICNAQVEEYEDSCPFLTVSCILLFRLLNY